MIKKLSQKIFLLIMISLSTIILGVIILFEVLNYKNTINVTTSMLDKFISGTVRKNVDDIPKDTNIEGIYNITVENSKVRGNSSASYDKVLEEYAIKLSKQNKESGIIGKYIYRVRKIKDNVVECSFIEDTEAILHIRMIFISSILASIASLIIIYTIAKKSSEIIVKPIEETFEKQKQFISDASHELKTPLTVIEANADVLENEVGNNKWLNYIQNEIESMNKLINELLLLAKTENVDSIKTYKKFDLSKEVEIIISVFESMAYENKVKINTNIQKDISMNGNKEDIEHILSTLLDNAIKHTKPEGKVTIELSKEKNEIVLQVKNMGDPIPEEEREKIFERFYRIDKSRNRNQKRYGLGLAIAKSTVEKYNGKIQVICKDGVTNFKVNLSNKY